MVIYLLGVKLFRIFVVGGSYFLLCFKPDSSPSFFKSLAIFSCALLYDYYTLREEDKSWKTYQNVVAILGIVITTFFAAFGVFGAFGGFELVLKDHVFYIETAKDFLLFHYIGNLGGWLKIMMVFPTLAFLELFNGHKRVTVSGNASAAG